MPHAVTPLPYPYGGLEPTIDELTMRLHHDKHHAGYVAGLNAAPDHHAVPAGPLSAAGAGRFGGGWAWRDAGGDHR